MRSGELGEAFGGRLQYEDLSPEVVLPAQVFDGMAATDTPEKRLMTAVLFDAIAELRREGSVGAKEVRVWIREEETHLFSFQTVCDVLGINATHLARGLLNWQSVVSADGKRQSAIRRGRVNPGRIRSLPRKGRHVRTRK